MSELIETPKQTLAASQTQTVALAAAVLDKRIATAKQWPRSISQFKREAIELLSQDVETARSAEYSKPVGNGTVRGPSVRLTEIACLCWRNIEVEFAEPIVGERSVTVQAYAWDVERNIRVPGIASTSIVNRQGIRYPDHMIDTTIMATAAKARRNAVLGVIPRAYITDLVEEARKVASANKKPLEQSRAEMLEWFARAKKISAEQVYAFLGVDGVDDITEQQIDELRAVAEALKEGEDPEGFFGKAKTKAEIAKERVEARKAGEG